MFKRLAVCALLGMLTVWGLALHGPARLRRHTLPYLRAMASPAPERNQELSPIRKYHDVVRPRRLDAWTIIGPGGGGTFYEPAVSPHDPNLVFATTDMTQCYVSEDGGGTWREFNLRGPCRVSFDPKRPGTVYAVTKDVGVYRSDDRGHTWNMVYPDPRSTRGVFYMDDDGEPHLQAGCCYYTGITAFAVDPEDSDSWYIAVPQQLQVTHDAGKHWKVLAEQVRATVLFVDPASPLNQRAVIIGLGDSVGLWDGKRLFPPTPAPGAKWINGFAYGSGGKLGRSVLYTASDFTVQNGVVTGGGLQATDDGGRTWRSLNEGFLKLAAKDTYPEFSAIGTSQHHPEVLYVSLYHLNLPNDSDRYYGVVKTTDGGATWSVVTRESGDTAPNMHDSWISYRFGPDWGEQPLGLGVDPKNPDLVYRTDLGRIMKSVDGGKNWEGLYSQGTDHGYTTTGLDVTTCYGIHFDPFDQKRVFISYTDIGLFRSEDGGGSWVSATSHGVPAEWLNTTYWVEFDPAVKGRMWAVMSGTHDLPRMRIIKRPGSMLHARGGVLVSADGGKTWSVSSQGLPQMAATHILLDPTSPPEARVLYVTGFGHGVFKSTDGGKSWTARNQGLPQEEPLTWRMAMDRDGALYVVTIRRSETGRVGTGPDGAVYRSRDGAATWEPVPLPKGVNGPLALTPDPEDPARLYLAVWGRYTLYGSDNPQDGGVFLSTDSGRTWSNVLSGSRRIYDVTIDPRNPNIVYATGFDASAWRSGDRGKTWKRIRGFNFKDAHRVIPDPADPSRIYIATFGSSIWHGPAEGDPNAVEDIVSPPPVTFAAPLLIKLP